MRYPRFILISSISVSFVSVAFFLVKISNKSFLRGEPLWNQW